MHSRHTTVITLAAVLLVAATPIAYAQTLRLPLAPLRLNTSSTSSSSVSSSSTSSSSSSSSSSSAAATAKSQSPSQKTSKNPGVGEYCMSISVTLHKADKLKADEDTMNKVDQTVDMLTKAQTICTSMGFPPPAVFTDSSFSSSGGPTFTPSSSTLSSSSSPFVPEGSSQLCTLIGKAGKRGGVQMCRYDCSGKTKVMVCQ